MLAGWTVTEVGRQPWTVYGLMRTADSVSPSLTGSDVLVSFVLYMLVYLIVFPVGLYFMVRVVRAGPIAPPRTRPSRPAGRANRCVALPASSRGARHDARFRADLDADPRNRRVLSTCCSTASISASAFSYRFAPDARARNLIMNSIAPMWDGNETWLVLGGVGLLAAFPLAFAIIMPAVYFPILVMLLALIFRGVAFEFRFRDAEHFQFWDKAFWLGSTIATFAQGVVLGAFIQGFQVDGRHFVGGSFDCFTPFSMVTGIALLFGYGLARRRLAGAEDRGRSAGLGARGRALVFARRAHDIGIVSIWTPLADPAIAERWFSWPNIAFLAPVPLITLVARAVRMARARTTVPKRRPSWARSASSWCPISASPSACGR